jgi:hypothetical protein
LLSDCRCNWCAGQASHLLLLLLLFPPLAKLSLFLVICNLFGSFSLLLLSVLVLDACR